MNQIAERKKFYDNGNSKRIKENFQGYLFENIDLTTSPLPIVFNRSDFRSTKISSCNFLKNDFSRADFFDCMIENTIFKDCIFKYSEFQNCFYEKTLLNNCEFKSSSFSRLVFNDCRIQNGKWKDITAKDTTFKKCIFKSTAFLQNSFDEVKFDECELENVDFSNMTAVNLYFNNCFFSSITVEADYIGSYYFKGTDFNFAEIKLKYRGRLFKVDLKKAELLGNLFKIYIESGRYYEAINILVQKNVFNNEPASVLGVAVLAIKELLNNPNVLSRIYQLEKIFHLFEFYFNSNCLPIDDYFDLLAFVNTVDISDLNIQDQLSMMSCIQKLKNLFQITELSEAFIATSKGGIGLLEITLDEKDKSKFLPAFKSAVANLLPRQVSNTYSILGTRKGSIIFEIAINASAGLVLLKILKAAIKQIRGISNEVVQIALDFTVNRKVLEEAKKTKGIEKLNQIRKAQLLSDQIITKSIAADNVKIEDLTSIVKSAKYFPNAFSKGNE